MLHLKSIPSAVNVTLLAATLLGFLLGCSDDIVPPATNRSDYFPVDAGIYRTYQVDSVVHAENDNNNDDSVYSYHFQVMEVIDTAFLDAAGDTAEVLLRYHRPDSSMAWTLTSVWTQKVKAVGAYRTEENILYQKLAYPISSQVVWDANAGNMLGEELHYYESIHHPATIGSFSFDSTVTVFEQDEDNFVERIFGRETYAAGIGLVFKQRDELGKRNGYVVSGTAYRMELIAYGRR